MGAEAATLPGLLRGLTEALGREVRAPRAMTGLERLHASDRITGFSHWARTASVAAGLMREAGLTDVEVIEAPADGRTRYGDWLMPLAWDADEARLELVDASGRAVESLCDTAREPNAIVPGSAPTPPDGLTCELVDAESLTNPELMRGRMVMTGRRASLLKLAAARAGALGIASDYHPNPSIDPTSTYWENVWGDAPGAWMQSARDGRLPGFSLSPAAGARLRRILDRRGGARVRATVRSRIYEGTLPIVTGCVRGSDPGAGEVLISAHIFEPGAHDNASGGAAVLEAARAIARLVATGEVMQPRPGIRFMLQAECYGTMAWIHLRSDRARRTRAAVTLDGVGKPVPLIAHRTPACMPSSLNALARRALEARFPGEGRARMRPFSLGDNLINDPAIGIPCVWLQTEGPPNHHHTSADTLAAIYPPSLADAAVVAGAIAYSFAAASEGEFWRPTPRDGEAAPTPRHRRPPTAGSAVPTRTVAGPLTFESLPLDEALPFGEPPRWWSPALAAYWWIDGARTVAEIRRLVYEEFPGAREDPADTLRRLTRAGYVTWGATA